MARRKNDKMAQPSDGIMVSSTYRPRWTSKFALLAAAIVVIVAASCSILWLRLHKSTIPNPHIVVTADEVSFIDSEANSALQDGGLQAGLKIYSQAISEAANNSVHASLAIDAANMALNNNAPASALSYALQADTIMHDATSSGLVASVYQLQGDNSKAILYYQKAAKEVSPNQIAGDGKQYYLDKAQALSGEVNK